MDNKKLTYINLGLVGLALLLFIGITTGTFNNFMNDSNTTSIRENSVTNVAAASLTPTPSPTVVSTVPTGPITSIKFAEETFDFGTVNAPENVEHIYKFKNTGTEPLTITKAKGSCGCTVPDWPKEPIGVGEEGEIKVVFNSRNKSGKQNKNVTITANTNPPQTIIRITGEVIAAEKSAAKATGK